MHHRWISCALGLLLSGVSGLSGACGASGPSGPSGDDDDGPDSPDASDDSADARTLPPSPDAMPVSGLDVDAVDRYVVLGDSLSVGDFPGLLYADLGQRFPGVQKISRAESGATIDDVNDHQIPGLQPWTGPVLVTLTIGGNDFKESPGQVMNEALSNAGAMTFAGKLDQALAALEGKYSGDLWVLVTNIHDPTDGEAHVYSRTGLDGDVCDLLFLVEDLNMAPVAMGNLLHWNQVIGEVVAGRDSATLADLHDLYLGHALNATHSQIAHYHATDPTVWLKTDCAHPNMRGDQEIADMFLRLIE